MFSLHPFSEACTEALNRIVAYHLHTSHVYLAMTYSFKTDKETPPFVSYFELLAETRRDNAAKFLNQLWTRNKQLCPPVFETVDLKEITTPIKALTLSQDMEKRLTSILIDLKASARYESDLLKIIKSILCEQRVTEDYLEEQLTHHKMIERERAQVEKPSTSSGREELRRRSKRSKSEFMKPGA